MSEPARQLFRQATSGSKTSTIVDALKSPYAQQDLRTGHLNCTLCQTVIKKSALWPAHELTEKHVRLLQAATHRPPNSPIKANVQSENDPRGRSGEDAALPNGFFDSTTQQDTKAATAQIHHSEPTRDLDTLMAEFENEIGQINEETIAGGEVKERIEPTYKQPEGVATSGQSKQPAGDGLEVENSYLEKEAEEDEVEDSIRDRLERLKRKISARPTFAKAHKISKSSDTILQQDSVDEDEDVSEEDNWRMTSIS
jgi:hypothetical protein